MTLFHLSLKSCKSIDVAKASRSSLVLDVSSVFFLAWSSSTASLLFAAFCRYALVKSASVREEDALAVLVELEHNEVELVVKLSLAAIFLHEVLRSYEAFNAILELNNSTLVVKFDDSTFVSATFGEYSFEYIPRIFFELLVTEAETTVFLVDFEHQLE